LTLSRLPLAILGRLRIDRLSAARIIDKHFYSLVYELPTCSFRVERAESIWSALWQ